MKNIKRVILLLGGLFFYLSNLYSDEGFRLPLLDTSIYNKIRPFTELSREDIYDEINPSLKDAVVLLAGGCTGVIVSSEGLVLTVLTNHHCGYQYIQNKSSVENNLLKKGFCASEKKNELPNDNLSVRFLIKTMDVTNKVLHSSNALFTEQQRNQSIRKVTDSLRTEYTKEYPGYEVEIKPMYRGNKYVLYLYENFPDVRLVYAPPIEISKFGGSADNWGWPRYTGDFALFRVYANKENKPSDYSEDNVPYKPKKIIPISTQGIKENDFTMVIGYPGFTKNRITSDLLSLVVNDELPMQIKLLEARLDILNRLVHLDSTAYFKWGTSISSLNNIKKKNEGIVQGALLTNAIHQKREIEKLFQKKVGSNSEWNSKYGTLLNEIGYNCDLMKKYELPYLFYTWGLSSIQLLKIAERTQSFIKNKTELKEGDINTFLEKIKKQYFEYDVELDKQMFVCMTHMYKKYVDESFYFSSNLSNDQNSINLWATDIYTNSALNSFKELENTLQKDPAKLMNDPAIAFANEISEMLNEKVWPFFPSISISTDSLFRKYEEANIEISKFTNEVFWPDANGGMRLSYGKVKGYTFQGITYPYFTTLDEMVEKYGTSEKNDFQIPLRLKSLYEAEDVKIPVCFMTDCQTSSGNSGSPVLNRKGELAGLNFDRNWEGTMSDYMYSPKLSRNIAVDSRYILFILNKFSGAQNIIDELTIH